MQLSKRQIKIILALLDLENAITTKELAEQFQMSIRTIKYDLDAIKTWFTKKDSLLCTQRNKGIWLDVTDSKRIELKNELLQVERYELYPDQEIRIHQMITILCLQTTYLTTQQLADDLKVSKSTIVADLEKLEQVLMSYQLQLIRKNYFGYTIVGAENQIRLLLEFIIQKGITDYDIYNIMNVITNPTEESNHQLKLAIHSQMQQIYQVTLFEISKIVNQEVLEQFNYSEILSIILRVTIATARMNINHTIESYKILPNQGLLETKKELPFLLMRQVFSSYEFPILEDEYIYIFSDVLMAYEEHNIADLTRQMIAFVSEKEEVAFNGDQQLFTNLFAHLSLKLHKKYLFVNEYNPFTEDIKQRYPSLFQTISDACQKEISKSVSIINDSFISYIALHFLVSFEKLTINQTIVRIVYICSTGLGVTSLIQQRIMEEVPNVEIASFASVLKVKEVLQEVEPDLVVSIFPLEDIQLPFVKVNPIPTKSDIATIRKMVEGILQGNPNKTTTKFMASKGKPSQNGIEEESRELILMGFLVYEELIKLFNQRIQEEYEAAFLLHVYMMVHRIYFQSQYENEGNVAPDSLLNYQEEVAEIESIMAKNKLPINKAEITALLQYLTI